MDAAVGAVQSIPDFRMVTFSLAGKDYGVDIMKVKEISKEARYTFVPNTLHFVLGVHNLRGEIISMIDLRKMFRLPYEQRTEPIADEVIILRLDDLLIGVVVDIIDRVITVPPEAIQPPHPIFGDINVEYIHGVVESEGRLYIILDVDRVFSEEQLVSRDAEEEQVEEVEEAEEVEEVSEAREPTEVQETRVVEEVAEPVAEAPPADAVDEVAAEAIPEETAEVLDAGETPAVHEELDYQFVAETLATFGSFYVTHLNSAWTKARLQEWQQLRTAADLGLQLESQQDSDEFLGGFFSPHTGELWAEDYRDSMLSILPNEMSGPITVWNIGCGRGHEAYSLACLLRLKYPAAILKVWGNDNDLLAVSSAGNLVLAREEIPDYFIESGFLQETEQGYQFVQEIQDLATFEYHDIGHRNDYEGLAIIVARDVVSFFEASIQERLLAGFRDKLKDEGLLILGMNEIPPETEWERVKKGDAVSYRKATQGLGSV